MRKRFFSIIVCVVMLFTMNVTAFAAETQENLFGDGENNDI